MERSELLSEPYNQLQVALAHVNKGSEREIDHNDLVGSDSSNITTQKFHAEANLNQLLEMKTSECEIVSQHIEAEVKDRNACVTDAVENLEQHDSKEYTPHSPSQELETKPEANADPDLNNDLLAKGTETKVLETSSRSIVEGRGD
ncbi:hypothetical protein AQUCO_05800201v1 [Aquilegia coerulea]|uniref:Uncharacterized protein n=1 Tax=Aquilegia coerulea TaxID=218851 RepID=A0A2G5CFE8_AQUCA|nr:hypothetical protein AQUCO_05800201v1 [Aquilegia coerulea]